MQPAPAEARALADALGLSVTVAHALWLAGHRDAARTGKWLSPKLAELTPPDGMHGREAAADRIARAIDRRERIAIFGDYDCDGITATAVLTESFRAMGADVTPLLASRFDGGYGLSDPALDRVLATKPTLLVTCDCGSADHPRVARAMAAGVDVIVIDHHLVPTEPLPAFAFLNPHLPVCEFPYKGLASCGLALSVAAAVRAKRKHAIDLRRSLDLVAIGTIADVAPLDGDNRALVRAGLAAIAHANRPGLRALADHARLDLGQPVDGGAVSFRIAPRLNAPGRMESPDIALALLLATDPTEARKIAARCEQLNEERRAVQDRILEEALVTARADGRAAIVLAHERWHHGVVGIVAGRLATELGKPAVVGAIEHGVARCSVRSARGVPVVTALARMKELLLGFGGHEKAAGCTFAADKLADVQDAFAHECERLASAEADERGPCVPLDAGDDLNRVLADLQRLEPCGEGNRAPLLRVEDAKVLTAKEVRGGHLKLEIELRGSRVSAFGGKLGGRAGALGERITFRGALRADTFRGNGAVELAIDSIEGL